MSSAGMHNQRNEVITDFEHVQQSIGIILTTPIGSRVMRREFGSELFDLIDRPMTSRIILAAYAATVNAIARWEPRFVVTGCELRKADVTGETELALSGIYYPRGHLGDMTPAPGQQKFSVRLQ